MYLFEAEKFGVSETSIHLLRNRFNYKTIDFKDIDSIVVKKGKDLKNWLWVLLVGLLLVGYSIFDLLQIFNIFSEEGFIIIYIERLLIPVFPLLLGIYSIIISLRIANVMIVQVKTQKIFLSLRKLDKTGKLEDFKSWIKVKYPISTISG